MPYDPDYGTPVTVRLPKHLLHRVDRAVERRRGQSRSHVIRLALETELDPAVIRGGRTYEEAVGLKAQMRSQIAEIQHTLSQLNSMLPAALLTAEEDLDDERVGVSVIAYINAKLMSYGIWLAWRSRPCQRCYAATSQFRRRNRRRFRSCRRSRSGSSVITKRSNFRSTVWS